MAHLHNTKVFPYTPVPHKPLPSDPQTRADILHVLQHGYIILENQFPAHVAHAAKLEIDLLSSFSSSSSDGSGTQGAETGRNAFEGFKTSRIYSLLNKSREFDGLVMLERVMRLNAWFLDPGFCLTAFHSIVIEAGSEAQPLHHDDGFVKLPRPHLPLGTGIIIALDDFTADNGATRIIPGSHLLGDAAPASKETSSFGKSNVAVSESSAIPAICPAGSVIFFPSTTWHSGGENATAKSRYSLTVQYCQPWMRQIENQYLSVDPRKLDTIPKEIVRLMGFAVFEGFIGYVDGLSPREAARRQIKWLRNPVEWRPSTFAHHGDSKL